MMPKIKYFITADHAAIDPQTGKTEASGFFDNIFGKIFPSKAPNFFVVVGLLNIEESAEILLKILRPDGEDLAIAELTASPHSINDTQTLILEVAGLPLSGVGAYKINVYYKKNMELLGSYFINVTYPPKRIFKEGEIVEILNNPDLIKGALIKVKCEKCGREYKFAINLDKNKPIPEGYLPFPEDDIIECCTDVKIDITGIRRDIEWSYGKPKPKQEQQ